MTLEQIEQALQEELEVLNRIDHAVAERLRVYEVLAQVKQAQHLEHIANRMDENARLLAGDY